MVRAWLAVPMLAVVAATGRTQRPHAAPPAVVWATDSTAPCVGLTVTFDADSAHVQALVGSRWAVPPAHEGNTTVSLFATRCPRSTVGGRRVRDATIAAVIVGVLAPGGSANAASVHTAAVPIVYGAAGAPATELFRSFGFTVRDAAVSVRIDSSGSTPRVSFTVATGAGRIEASAPVVDTARTTVRNSRLVGTGIGMSSEFTGPEWSRHGRVTVTVQATGTTIFSELHASPFPTGGFYDAGFGWRFRFRRQ